MSTLAPLATLFDEAGGDELWLPPALGMLYGSLRFPSHRERAHVVANFVTTLDGVVALEEGGGGPISGFNEHDRMVMGLLRAAAAAVVVAAGTVGPAGNHLWTAEEIFPPLAEAYQQMRARLGMTSPPRTVIVTGSGRLDQSQRVLASGEVPVLILTTAGGAERLGRQRLAPHVEVVAVQEAGAIQARTILEQVRACQGHELVLVEGGPHLMAPFFAEHCLDELFLTLAPQVAGRDGGHARPGLVAGQRFAPDDPLWAKLVSVRRAGDHLFLRYAFSAT